MSICINSGIRIYPVPKYGSYFIEVEINKKPKRGTQRFDPRKNKWVEKIHELYRYFYNKYEL